MRGAFILVGFSLVATAFAAAEVLGLLGVVDPSSARLPLMVVGLPLAVGTAVYTAFLFGQAEGRDLWQSTLLPVHLLVQAVMMGAAGLVIVGAVAAFDGFSAVVAATLGVAVAVDLFVTLLGEFGMPHASEVAARAAHAITRGAYRNHFWVGSIVVGHVVPLALLAVGGPLVAAVAAVLTIAGLYLFEYAFVMAPQEIPNS